VVGRHASAEGSWEVATRPPDPRLRPAIHSYTGYREDMAGPLRRRELPSGHVTLILSFGEPIALLPAERPAAAGTFTSFLVGLDDGPTITEHAGRQHGVQVDLSPLGAYALLGGATSEYASAVVPLADLPGQRGDELAARLADAPGWAARFALLDQVLGARIAAGPAPAPEVAWAWRRLQRVAGRGAVAELAEEVGWSHRHLICRFREQIGLAPKAAARVLRFERAVGLLAAPGGPPWAELAVRCGYYDQAHLNREFRALAGCTPTELVAGRGFGLGGAPALAQPA